MSAPPAGKVGWCAPDSTVRQQPLPPASRVPKTLHQKVGVAPAVLPAHEGQSVNPDGEAYEDLACMAAAKELEREQEDENLDRKLHPMNHALRQAFGADEVKAMDDETKIQ